MRGRFAATAFLAMALLAAGCSKKADPPATPPATPPPAEEMVTATHLLVKFTTPKQANVHRTKEEAKKMAESLLLEIQGGRPFDPMIPVFTEDRNPRTNAVNPVDPKTGQSIGKPGQYTFGHGQMVKAFEEAAFATPVGKMHPTPVETEFGYHLIRRDK